ncbi:MAG TPA: CocE/NonD family hydrolase [Candidatus Deferrimicrobium sp.]|nr:CocE/NonD family hydrolase [Candidatus Deferrimicrobium sp.]
MNENYPFKFTDKSVEKSKNKGYTRKSFYITMRDGVKLAADLYVPKEIAPDIKLTTVLVQTCYWRSYKFRIPFKWLMPAPRKPKIVKGLTAQGMAVLWVDVRGTGASYGTRPYPFSKEEVKDAKDICDWIIAQSWSDGNIVTYGNSYSGVTSEFTASINHPAVKAILTKHNPWDFYLHAAFPNGCFNEAFISFWSSLGKALDSTNGRNLIAMKPFDPWLARIASIAVKSVMPVDSDKNLADLKEVAEIHKSNRHPIDYFEQVKSRDDIIDDEGTNIDTISSFSKKAQIEKSGLPFYTWGSWQDSTTANAIIHRFLNFSNPQKAVIGDWCHRGKNRASPFYSHKKSAEPSEADQIRDWVVFYRDCLENRFNRGKTLYYYTMGEEKWKKTETWPPANQVMIPWYLNNNNVLSKSKPTTQSAADAYTINYESTTGIRNRWYTLLSLPVFYPEREAEDQKLLCYTSAPLEEDIEITGHPIITLFMKSTHEDGMVHVHLEFLDEDGTIHWITDGELRLVHRKISNDAPPYKMAIPYHSFKNNDILPLTPGELTEIKFALYPTSILLRRGQRIRVAIGGADKNTFARYPEEGTPTITIEHNTAHASCIELPII